MSLVEAAEMLRLTTRQQILIGELIADHVVPTISRLDRGSSRFITPYSKQDGDL